MGRRGPKPQSKEQLLRNGTHRSDRHSNRWSEEKPATGSDDGPGGPPRHLSTLAGYFWCQVAASFLLEPHAYRLLQLACEAWDRAQGAREILNEQGLTYVDRFDQPRPRPELKVEHDARLSFAKLLRELNLDEPPPVGSRMFRDPPDKYDPLELFVTTMEAFQKEDESGDDQPDPR